MVKFVFVIIFAAFSSVAFADEQNSASYATCMDKTGGVTVEMLNCMATEFKVQDARLNDAYKNLTAPLTAPRKQQLVAAQRLWVRYRDVNCDFYADPTSGSVSTLQQNGCILHETTDRAAELERLGAEP